MPAERARIPNLVLQAHRERRDLSQQDVAEAIASLAWTTEQRMVGVNADMVSKWERGEKLPSKPYRKLLCALYDATPEQLAFRQTSHGDYVETGGDINRRELLRGAALIGTAALTHPLRVPRRIDPETVSCLHGMLAEYAKVDNLLGPQPLLATMTVHLDYISELLTVASGGIRAKLLAVGAHYAEFAGWLYQDAGNMRTGVYWSDRALSWAQAGGDPLMTSYVLMRRSNQASGSGDARRTLGLAQLALRAPDRLSPRARALIHRQEAHGYALSGDAAACASALEAAREQVARTDDYGPAERAVTGYCTPAYIELEAAGCWMTLGQPAKAVAIYQQGLAQLPPEYPRDRGVQLARLATAHAVNQEPEQACRAAEEAITLAGRTGSGRAVGELLRLPVKLAAWQDLPAVAHLTEVIARAA